jgi:hypothetical protein
LTPGSAALTTRQLLCPAIGTHSAIRLSLGAAPVLCALMLITILLTSLCFHLVGKPEYYLHHVVQVPNGGGVMLQIRPPLLLDNALPMPLGVTVWDGDTLLTRCA